MDLKIIKFQLISIIIYRKWRRFNKKKMNRNKRKLTRTVKKNQNRILRKKT
jgi:hypothetical protein